MFDSCIHFQKNSFNYIEKISKKLSLNKINYALAMYDSEKKITDRIKFKKNCEKFNNLIPVAFLRNSKNIKSEINNIVKLKYKFIKIHPRILRKSLSDVKFYTKVFNELKKTNLVIMWCTFDGWEDQPSESNQINVIAGLIKIAKKNKILLMHGGGPNILKYYEKFRFINRVFLDLSYTLVHYYGTSVEKDIAFLAKKFDKRIVIGCDYPTINLKKYLSIVKNLSKKAKLNKIKKENIFHNNLYRIFNS